jgi:hypothetical protein
MERERELKKKIRKNIYALYVYVYMCICVFTKHVKKIRCMRLVQDRGLLKVGVCGGQDIGYHLYKFDCICIKGGKREEIRSTQDEEGRHDSEFNKRKKKKEVF